ncbi:FAD-dependent monooxygenase [Streptomyces radicis]|uniref:FAD-binding monooxygenase n=1 Tax=Streptomyces radicis TaxID=1750517 RepID=A0A3A9WAU8_9ACTN|nr:FAD-dependent monooxygenase [Streptomyces radicis]RKN09762.1 FAD-binding monooxygenase [Streptomyces radicis]RKN23399.1 FAD-binding monooxygenase [Streptomyces radicis]
MTNDIDVPVLIVGGGAGGLTAALLLARMEIPFLLVDAAPGASPLPRAHVLNQRAMEILRDVGLAEAVYAAGTPAEQMAYSGWYVGLSGDGARDGDGDGADHGRRVALLESWGGGGRSPDWLAASPERQANLPQHRLEPLLRARAERLAPPGALRFPHELTALRDDGDAVTAAVTDLGTGAAYRVRARYLLGCDGGRTVGPALGVAHRGARDVARMVSFHFSADLSRWARDPEVLIRWLWLPDLGTGGVLVPMGPGCWGPASEEWVFHLHYPADEPRALDDAAVLADLRAALGPAVEGATVHGLSRWAVQGALADRFRAGRVLLTGDAAHRHPPTGGLGLTSAMHDAQNVTWKLAAVLRGHADDALLDSYEAERRPVAAAGVRRALASARNQLAISAHFGGGPGMDPAENWRLARRLWGTSPEDRDARRAFLRTVAAQSMEFNELGVEFGYTYETGAVVPDGTPPAHNPDPVRIHQPSARPGHPLPHAWLTDLDGNALPVARLIRPGAFLLIAGEEGREWCEAAEKVAARTGLPLTAVRIGHLDGDYRDPRSTWTRWRGHGPEGAVLVRPDRFIGWRAPGAAPDPHARLAAAVDALLGRSPGAPGVV